MTQGFPTDSDRMDSLWFNCVTCLFPPFSAEFDVEDFPESDAPDISEFSPSDKQSVKATKPQEKRKRSGRKTSDDPKAQEKPVKADSKSKEEKKPVKADSKSKEIAHFLPTENTPQAKYFKKASSKRSPTAPRQATSEQKVGICNDIYEP